ncbi:MAG: PIN domain-containing protein [Bacteroidota bacterium]
MSLHVFVDTNVFIDFFADRRPYSFEAAQLFDYALNKSIKLYTSAVSYNNMYYILRQSNSHQATLKMLSELNEWTETVDVSSDVIKKALKSEFKDFEDAIQYHCAKSLNKIDFIVTRNTKDFKTSSLGILSPKEALALMNNRLEKN